MFVILRSKTYILNKKNANFPLFVVCICSHKLFFAIKPDDVSTVFVQL